MSKKLRKIRLTSSDCEIHYVYEECCLSECFVEALDCDECEARRASRIEACKPLLLIRE